MLFLPLKLYLQNSGGHRLHGSKTPQGRSLGVQSSAGHKLWGPKLRGAKIEGKFAPQTFGLLNLCPAEFWTPQPVPRWVLEQCNLCPAKFWRHSFSGQNTNRFFFFSFYFRVFSKSLTFQRSIQLIWPLFKEKIFSATISLNGNKVSPQLSGKKGK